MPPLQVLGELTCTRDNIHSVMDMRLVPPEGGDVEDVFSAVQQSLSISRGPTTVTVKPYLTTLDDVS